MFLRKIAQGETDMSAFGDISTLTSPNVIRDILGIPARHGS